MAAAHFSTGEQFLWKDTVYEIRKRLSNGRLSIVNLEADEPLTVSLAQLVKALSKGELEFVPAGKKTSFQFKAGYMDLSDCPEPLRTIAEHRLNTIKPLLALSASERSTSSTTKSHCESRRRIYNVLMMKNW